MSSYADKRLHNVHEFTRTEALRYVLLDRWRSDPAERFFFEGCPRIPGQLWTADRKGLYDAIVRHRPACCFEIGTASGGGSTFFLASAFAAIGAGRVITMEASPEVHARAIAAYRRHVPHLLPHVDFLCGDRVEAFASHIDRVGGVPCCFLDGGDDPSESVRQFAFFQARCRPGSIFMAHDWNDEKMRLLRPLIESEPRWQTALSIGQPHSVGFVMKVLAA